MNRIGALTVASAIVLSTPWALVAQPKSRVSVTGTVEYARITEDDGYLGGGFGGAGSLQVHLTDATSLELEVAVEHHVRDLDFFAIAFHPLGRIDALPYTERWEGTATFVLGLVSHTFGSGRARPVIWGGGGLMTHGGTSRGPVTAPQVPPGYTLQPGDAEARRGRSSKAFAMDGGAGVDVRLTDRLTFRPFAGLRLANTGNFGPKYIIRGGGRIGFRW